MCIFALSKDITYKVIEIKSGSLKYQLDFNANWK